MRKALLFAITSLLLGASATSYAQQPPKQPPTEKQDEGTALTLKGCLTKGSQPQQYMVADEETGKKVAFAASSKLDSYVNQTVEVNGRVVDSGGESSFQPESIKSVAASCKGKKDQ